MMTSRERVLTAFNRKQPDRVPAVLYYTAKEIKPDILVFYHSCGNVWDAIPDLIDAGVDVFLIPSSRNAWTRQR